MAVKNGVESKQKFCTYILSNSALLWAQKEEKWYKMFGIQMGPIFFI